MDTNSVTAPCTLLNQWVEIATSNATDTNRPDSAPHTRPDIALKDQLDWMKYLARLARENQISEGQKMSALSVWSEARATGLKLPRASCAEHTLVMMWRTGRKHFSVELADGSLPEWSYSDLGAGTYDGGEMEGGAFGPQALRFLTMFV